MVKCGRAQKNLLPLPCIFIECNCKYYSKPIMTQHSTNVQVCLGRRKTGL